MAPYRRLCPGLGLAVAGLIGGCHQLLKKGVIQHHGHRGVVAGEHHWFAAALGGVDQFRQVLACLAHSELDHELDHERLEAYVYYVNNRRCFLT